MNHFKPRVGLYKRMKYRIKYLIFFKLKMFIFHKLIFLIRYKFFRNFIGGVFVLKVDYNNLSFENSVPYWDVIGNENGYSRVIGFDMCGFKMFDINNEKYLHEGNGPVKYEALREFLWKKHHNVNSAYRLGGKYFGSMRCKHCNIDFTLDNLDGINIELMKRNKYNRKNNQFKKYEADRLYKIALEYASK